MVAGHICLDITLGFNPEKTGKFDQILAPGKLINVEDAIIGTGGTVSNTGLALAKLGVEVKLNGKVGDDKFGSIIKNILGADKASSFKTVSGQHSSYTVVLSLPGIDRIFLHHTGTNDTFTADDVDYKSLSECSLLHFGYPTLMRKMYENDGHELYRIFKKAKELGVITSLDMTPPDPDSNSGKANWQTIFEKVLPYVDIFLPSVEEVAYVFDRDLFEKRKEQAKNEDPVLTYTGSDCSKLSEKLLDSGVKVAAIKAGIKGYYLRTSNKAALKTLGHFSGELDQWAGREIWAISYKAEKFGAATGAGDATIAGFLTAFLSGFDPVKCVKVANVLGWQNVREVDTLNGIEDWQATLDMIDDNKKELNSLTIDDAGWLYSDCEKIYYGPYDKNNKGSYPK